MYFKKKKNIYIFKKKESIAHHCIVYTIVLKGLGLGTGLFHFVSFEII